MAEFSLTLTNKRGSTVLTKYDILTHETVGLTFDENLNLNIEGPTLSFAMLKYLYEGSRKVVNTAALSINYGSIVQLVVNDYRYDFAITGIDYQFMPENLQLNFNSLNLFQFENQQVGIGYTITADTTDPQYLGAQPIDWWVNKILDENNVGWEYIDIDTANREILNNLNTNELNEIRTDTSNEEAWLAVEKTKYSTLNAVVSFECSNSNVYNALKLLADNNDLFIVVDYSARNFWFAPKQNPIFNGYYFNPYNNLQNFSLRGKGDNLITVLNIVGPHDLNDQEITLVPSFPDGILQFIESDKWNISVFSPDLYVQYTSDPTFLTQASTVPWLENKLINIDFFTNSFLLPTERQDIQDLLYNDLRIVNGTMIVNEQGYLKQYEEDYMSINQDKIDLERVQAIAVADIDNLRNSITRWSSDLNPIYINDIDENGTWAIFPPAIISANLHFEDGAERSISQGDEQYSDSYITYYHFNLDPIWEILDLSNYQIRYKTTSWSSLLTHNVLEYNSQYLQPKTKRLWFDLYPNIINNPPVGGECAELYLWRSSPTRNIDIRMTCEVTLNFQDAGGQQSTHYTLCSNGNTLIWEADNDSTPPTPVIITPLDFTQSQKIDFQSSDSYITFLYIPETISSAPIFQIGGFVPNARYSFSNFQIKFYYNYYQQPHDRKQGVEYNIDPFTLSITNHNSNNLYLFTTNQETEILPSGATQTMIQEAIAVSYTNSPAFNNHFAICCKKLPVTIDMYDSFPPMIQGDEDTRTPIKTVVLNDSNNILVGLASAQEYRNIHQKSPQTIAGLDERLTEICAQYQSTYELGIEGLAKFNQYWNTIGLYYANYRNVGEIPTLDHDTIEEGEHWSSLPSSPVFTATDINIIKDHFESINSEQKPLTRTRIIQDCALIANKLTEYWNVALSNLGVSGIYIASTWDCLHDLETSTNLIETSYYAPLYGGSYNSSTSRWSAAPSLNSIVYPTTNLEPHINKKHKYSFKYHDDNNFIKLPQQILNNSNTQTYYTISDNTDAEYYYAKLIAPGHDSNDNLILYETIVTRNTQQYYIPIQSFATALDIIYNFIYANTDISKTLNLNLQYLNWLASCSMYNRSVYYQSLQRHNEIWLYLHHNYPGVFRESVFQCDSVTNSQQLYEAARSELERLSKPSFEYSLTGMDIYAYDVNYLPTKIKLGEQIRIDYQEEMELNNTLNDALHEPLYITGISHALRNDGDYQFTVTTRAANDTMIQRFAQLLNFGR